MSARPERRRATAIALLLTLVIAGCTTTTSGKPKRAQAGPSSPAALVPDGELLGAAAAFPSGDADQAAAALAGSVLKGGPQEMPALLAAIRASGLGIRDLAAGGKVVQAPAEPSQGLAFQAGEVLAMSKLLSHGYAVSLADLASLVQNLDPTTLAKAPVQTFLVAGIRAAATSKSPTRRLWGRFIVELGKQASPSYDLLSAAPATAQLDAAQAMFVLLRLFGDLDAKVAPAAAVIPSGSAHSFAPAPADRLVGASKPACSPGEREAEILDATSVGAAYGFEQFLDWTSEHLPGHTLHAYAKAIPWINAMLAAIKFIATAATFNGKLELADGEPLIRTKTTTAGEQRDLTVTVSMDTGKSTFLNCLRILFNAAGLDFSLPADGPVDGAEITWTLLSGNESVRLCALPCGSGGTSTNNARSGHTDEAGEAKLGVEGVPQKHKLLDSVTPVPRRAVVRAGVNLKPAKLFRDLTDAAGTAGGGGAGVVTFPAELLTRIGFFGAGLGFAVTDWGERWQIDAKLRVDHLSNTSASTAWIIGWTGVVTVDASGVVTGDGTGSLSGGGFGGECTAGGNTAVVFGGTWPVTFDGTKVDTQFNLGLHSSNPAVLISGAFGNCTALVKQILTPIITKEATDVGSLFGTDQFSFPGGRTATLHAPAHVGFQDGGQATLTITSTQLK